MELELFVCLFVCLFIFLGKVIGYTVFFTMTAVEDLDEWEQKSIPVTGSAELSSLERNSQYAITVAARTKSGYGRLSEKVTVTVKPEDVPTELRASSVSTHSMTLSWQQPIRLNPLSYNVTFDAIKEFVDSQGITQLQVVTVRSWTDVGAKDPSKNRSLFDFKSSF